MKNIGNITSTITRSFFTPFQKNKGWTYLYPKSVIANFRIVLDDRFLISRLTLNFSNGIRD